MSESIRITWEQTTASGRRTSWARVVTELLPGRGAKSFGGSYLQSGVETDLPVGSIVLEVVPMGSVKNGHQEAQLHVVAHSGLERLPGAWDWHKGQLSLRDQVKELLAQRAKEHAETSGVDICVKIDQGAYNDDPDLYAKMITYPKGSPERKAAANRLFDDQANKRAQFKADAIAHCGLSGKIADRAFEIAWDERHAGGYREVVDFVCDLADLCRLA